MLQAVGERLNESPSEKEGKCAAIEQPPFRYIYASMKALPKRKGNEILHRRNFLRVQASMKALPKRKGNVSKFSETIHPTSLNESPSEKEGKLASSRRRPS